MTTSLPGHLESRSSVAERVRGGVRRCKSHCAACDRCFTSDTAFDAHIRYGRHVDLTVEHVGTTRWELAPLAGRCDLWNGSRGVTRDATLWERAHIPRR